VDLETSDWIAIIGILLATILGIIALFKKGAKSTNLNVSQNSGHLSKSKQKQKVTVKESSNE
jgi:LPXTG-motif cell wall-anchored protein|tara:strand:- start:5170 stop:5355 length:186 start_codon:yes stop_codon:yes gene_type:complete